MAVQNTVRTLVHPIQGRLPLDINEILAWIFSSKRRRRGQVTGGREGPPIAQI